MSFRPTNMKIGALALLVVFGGIGGYLGLQKLFGRAQQVPLRVVFEGSASGLRKGGSVNFGGIRIGEVISLKLDNPRRVIAMTRVDRDAPIRKDTLAGLEFQGLTGIASIALTGGSLEADPVPLDHDGIFIVAAYAAVTIGVLGLIVYAALDARRVKSRLATLDAQGVRRRSDQRTASSP